MENTSIDQAIEIIAKNLKESKINDIDKFELIINVTKYLMNYNENNKYLDEGMRKDGKIKTLQRSRNYNL